MIIDAPPTLGMVDAMLLASRASGVLMVGRIDHVSRNEVIKASSSLSRLNLIGIIANDVPAKGLNPIYESVSMVT